MICIARSTRSSGKSVLFSRCVNNFEKNAFNDLVGPRRNLLARLEDIQKRCVKITSNLISFTFRQTCGEASSKRQGSSLSVNIPFLCSVKQWLNVGRYIRGFCTFFRLLVDQLSQEKESLQSRCVDARTALQQMLSERQQLNENLIATHRFHFAKTTYFCVLQTYLFPCRFIKTLVDSLDESTVRRPTEIVPNILELSRTNLRLSENLKHKLLGSSPVFAGVLDAGIQNGMSPAEKLAYQVLV